MSHALAMPDLAGLPFWKMNGLGNDFFILDMRENEMPLSPEACQTLGARGGAFGCDQIITLTRDKADTTIMTIHNADGSPAEACGNASRCVGWLLMEEAGTDDVRFLTPAGINQAVRTGPMAVRVDMGQPGLHWQDIPLAEQMDDTRFIDIKLGPIDRPVLWGPSAVSMGNPHCVFFVEKVQDHAIDRFGPLIENHPLFPQGANVSIAEVQDATTIRVRVWERGAGLTKACGTAACAVLVSAVRRRLTGRSATILMDGGPLEVDWDETTNHVFLSGPVDLEFEGQFSG